MTHMSYQFTFDSRLGISIPKLDQEWEQYSLEEQEQILLEWEAYRSDIPERIKQLEKEIEKKQAELNKEERFTRSCAINDQISHLASTINDLNIWYRIQQETAKRKHM